MTRKPKGLKCPNCTATVHNHPQNDCVLAAMIQVLRDRGDHHPATLTRLHANCDADAFWNAAGAVIDRLGDSEFLSVHEVKP